MDAALALKSKKHDVTIVTSHHNRKHCFAETNDGQLTVISIGDWLPRRIFGTAFCMTIRMIWAALYICLFSGLKPDVLFCDQVSNAIPILKLTSQAKIIFYCHYPDQLLTTQRTSLAKQLYRGFMDWLEEKTTGMADLILVNSRFTQGVFQETFKSLSGTTPPAILHPSLNTNVFDELSQTLTKSDLAFGKEYFTFLSINRYERKKNIILAIHAFDKIVKSTGRKDLRFAIVGGYDSQVKENDEVYSELLQLSSDLKIGQYVSLKKSPSDREKVKLLRTCGGLIYTPSGEHFGIVPVEAMYHRLPVVAVNDGGPTETVVNGQTGYLCQSDPEDFAIAMKKLIDGGDKLKKTLGDNGHQRVLQNFSFEAFAQKLDFFVQQVLV